MNENTVQIAVALVLINLVAWGGYVALEDEPEIIYKYREPIADSANVTVSFDFGDLSNASHSHGTTSDSHGGLQG